MFQELDDYAPEPEVHKYLHSRLMHFDVPTLYELHYSSITLGKVCAPSGQSATWFGLEPLQQDSRAWATPYSMGKCKLMKEKIRNNKTRLVIYLQSALHGAVLQHSPTQSSNAFHSAWMNDSVLVPVPQTP